MTDDEIHTADIECPICGSTDSCPHLLATIDRSYCSCDGGYIYDHYSQYEKLIEAKFLQLLKDESISSLEWDDFSIGECWDYCTENRSSGDYMELDSDNFTDLVCDVLELAGGELIEGYDNVGMGGSTVEKTFYAANPEAVHKNALVLLAERLDGHKKV